ncbi:MAG: amino acid ABC transporter substrate-binding protein [Desulfobacterales bacterium]|nr:amino acid ABC transporter substrate-binding protein [Desulfobacterales bacterium]
MKKTVVFALMIFLISSHASADKITLATGEWTPYTSKKLEGYGFITEIVSEVFKETGVETEYKFYPWRRCYHLVKSGKIWGAFPYTYTEERANEVLFSDSVGESKTVFFYYKKKKDYAYDTLDNLKPFKLGGIVGYFYEEAFKKAGLQVDYAPDEISAINKLAAGRMELLPLNELVGWYYIGKRFPAKVNDFGRLEKAYSTDELKVIVSKQYPNSSNLLKQFNKHLNNVKTGDRYKAILKKYGISD